MSKLIAIGGGGFLVKPENQLLDRYCLECTGKTTPKVCFIPTASGDSKDFLASLADRSQFAVELSKLENR
ncbi:MAG TPA: Type 1 glutamine amidotransferase-like domain-containing protein [Xenococcaceae cyanobacterium]